MWSFLQPRKRRLGSLRKFSTFRPKAGYWATSVPRSKLELGKEMSIWTYHTLFNITERFERWLKSWKDRKESLIRGKTFERWLERKHWMLIRKDSKTDINETIRTLTRTKSIVRWLKQNFNDVSRNHFTDWCWVGSYSKLTLCIFFISFAHLLFNRTFDADCFTRILSIFRGARCYCCIFQSDSCGCRTGCCRFNYCLNNSTCAETCQDGRRFHCQCVGGFQGRFCDMVSHARNWESSSRGCFRMKAPPPWS